MASIRSSFAAAAAAITAPAFKLPPAVWLPNANPLPFGYFLFLIMFLMNAGYIVFHYYAPFEIKWWMTAAWLGVECFIIPIFVELCVMRRANFLSAVVQQDPRLVAGDAVAFGLLKRMPCFGRCREMDTLQKSLVNLYRASFRGRNVLYDGGFTQRSVISCDFDTAAEQRLLDDDDEDDWRSDWATPRDPVYPGEADAEFMNRRLSGGIGGSRNNSFNDQTPLTPRGAALAAQGGASSGCGDHHVNMDDGKYSLQRALLLHGVNSSEAANYSNPNTPRGSAAGGGNDSQMHTARSYGTDASSMISARSHQQRSAIPSGSFSPKMELGNVNAEAGDANDHHHHQHAAFMAYDPLGDNNTSMTYEQLMRGVPDTGASLLLSIVKQISPGTPLSAITFPVHVLEPRSLLEKFADVFRHSGILLDAASAHDPNERIRHVSRFFLSAYHLQLGARKPYNPIHGECFACRIELPQSGGRVVHFLAEQVSHHPPVTFIRAFSPGLFQYRAVYHAKTSLVSINCASSVGEGSAELILYPQQQQQQSEKNSNAASYHRYTMTWPVLYVSGFLYGSMRLELGGSTTIVDSQTQAKAQIDFLRKGWISGEYDVIHGTFADHMSGKVDKDHGPVLHGHWNKEIYYSPDASTATSVKSLLWNGAAQGSMGRVVAVDAGVAGASASSASVTPHHGHGKQSRNVWQRLTQALRQQDVARAVASKHEVEQNQREWRKSLADRGEKHVPVMFRHSMPVEALSHPSDLWDLTKWEDTDMCKQWMASREADLQIR